MTLVTERELVKQWTPGGVMTRQITIPAGTRCVNVNAGIAVDDISKVVGGNAHDLHHYYIWLDPDEVTWVEGQAMIFMATQLATRRTFVAELARKGGRKVRFSVMDAETGPDVLVDLRKVPLDIRRAARAALLETTPFVDVSTIIEYGLTQKLSSAIRCF